MLRADITYVWIFLDHLYKTQIAERSDYVSPYLMVAGARGTDDEYVFIVPYLAPGALAVVVVF